jgi:hypothetical protein
LARNWLGMALRLGLDWGLELERCCIGNRPGGPLRHASHRLCTAPSVRLPAAGRAWRGGGDPSAAGHCQCARSSRCCCAGTVAGLRATGRLRSTTDCSAATPGDRHCGCATAFDFRCAGVRLCNCSAKPGIRHIPFRCLEWRMGRGRLVVASGWLVGQLTLGSWPWRVASGQRTVGRVKLGRPRPWCPLGRPRSRWRLGCWPRGPWWPWPLSVIQSAD